MQSPLQLEFRVTADASGTATIEQGPQIPGQRWELSVATVKTDSVNNESTCEVYMNNTRVDGTYSGNLDSTDLVSGIPLGCGQKIKAVWTGADASAICTLSITGQLSTNYR